MGAPIPLQGPVSPQRAGEVPGAPQALSHLQGQESLNLCACPPAVTPQSDWRDTAGMTPLVPC